MEAILNKRFFPTPPPHKSDTFYASTKMIQEEGIDKSRGRVIRIGGDIFYSPNCQRTIHSVPETLSNMQRNPRYNSVSEFYEPLWWTMEYAHLAFIEMEPITEGPFNWMLAMPLYFEKRSKGLFRLDGSTKLWWYRLQHDLRAASNTLLANSGGPETPEIIQTVLNFDENYTNHHTLRSDVVRCRDWFKYWFARMSYAIAVTTRMDDYKNIIRLFVGTWFDILDANEWHQAFLSALLAMAATFKPTTPRAGVFLNILNPEKDQFVVDWFIRFNTPAWFPWGTAEIAAARTDRFIARLAPPIEQMQEIATFRTTSPSLPVYNGTPWVEFLDDRKYRCEEMQQWETAEKRQRRENRERVPPYVKTKVFVWVEDNGQYSRRQVDPVMNKDTILHYGTNQSKYNAFFNEWDCCSDFGDDRDDDTEYGDDEEDQSMHDIEMHETSADVERAKHGFYRTEHSGYDDGEGLRDCEYESVHILMEYFGFVPPERISRPQPFPKIKESKYTATLGLSVEETEFFNSDIAPCGIAFLDAYSSSKDHPKNEHWDLSINNRMQLSSAARLNRIRVISNKLFIFDMGSDATVPWSLAVESATIAVMRSQDAYTPPDISS
ncbi:hypothetical protein GALMADRAFT_148721 [Galerina marginata CBS 339.88]|uniref:Uncharacterized protein n=1 Tax=Galerina marginata (strain CBS 339.88) TaxID=685588 RepID=A0A067SF83_GALM3|nr:hypothetical protein GALMADRAFT_148721 [Galerina marginata CBS 339.88]